MKATERATTLSGIPLGGIGTGSVELRGDGRFHEWQVFNNPPWSGGFGPGATFDDPLGSEDFQLAVRVSTPSTGPVVRLLRTGASDLYHMPWVRCVEEIAVEHVFPFTRLTFRDPVLPVELELGAWSSFVPGDAKDSGIPGFHLELRAAAADEDAEVSLLALVADPFRDGGRCEVRGRGIVWGSPDLAEGHPMRGGSLCVLGPDDLDVTARDKAGQRNYLWVDVRSDGGLDPEPLPPPTQHQFPPVGVVLLFPETALEAYKALIPLHRSWVERVMVLDHARWSAEAPDDVDERWNALLHRAVVDRPKARAVLELLENVAADEMQDAAARSRVEARLLSLLHGPKLPRPEGAVCVRTDVAAGTTVSIPLRVGWFFPNHIGTRGERLGHRYEEWYSSALDVATDLRARAADLRRRTEEFSDTLAGSGPSWLGEAIGAQLTTLVKSSWWVRDGRYALWEGLGCCGLQTTCVEHHCSHVVALMFPELEQAKLRMTAAFQLAKDSPRYEEYVLAVPRNREVWEELPPDERSVQRVISETGIDAAGRIPNYFPGSLDAIGAYHMLDTQPQFALMVLRDLRWIGDLEEARRLWPTVVAAMRHSLSLDEAGAGLPYHYDPNQTSSIIGSHNYDAWDFYGYSSYVSGIHVAALDATRVLAERLGEDPEPWSKALERARSAMEEILWDEELGYYKLWVDPVTGREDRACMADQLSGQWLANLCGLPSILDHSRIVRALESIVKLCWKGPDEGLINSAYPDGKRPSEQGVVTLQDGTERQWGVGSQADTPWTGTEYATASLLIQEGLVDEGLMIARSAHERYKSTGMAFNHIECGTHYSRPLSVWAVLTALQGLDIDDGMVRTDPHPLVRGSVIIAPNRPLGRISKEGSSV